MGFQDRDYERSYDTGSGWRDGGGGGMQVAGGFASWSANSKLLAAIVAVYVAQNLFEGFTDLFALPSDWYTQPWRAFSLVTYSMLHSLKSLNHLLFNGLAIFFFGRAIEAKYGAKEYLAFFFTSAAFAGIVWSLTTLAEGRPGDTLIGASGGIAAILVLFALNFPNVQVYIMGVLPIPAWLMAVIFLGQDILGAISRSGNIAFTAHLGGALFGFLYFRYRWRLVDWAPSGFKMPRLKRRPKLKIHKEDTEPSSDPVDEQVDKLLAKIQREGQDSLTAAERRLLEKASRRYKQRRR